MRALLLLPLAAAIACTPPAEELPTTLVWDAFPFDGNRTWEFINTDDTVSYKLVAETREVKPDDSADYSVYTVDYSVDCVAADATCEQGELLRSIGWSSDAQNGVMIHSFENQNFGVDYEPPIWLSDSDARVGVPLTTMTDGFEWTATLEGFEHCPVWLNADWGPNCAHFSLDDGDMTGGVNHGLTGHYWAIDGQGVVAIQLDGEAGMWQLSESNCYPEEACNGDW